MGKYHFLGVQQRTTGDLTTIAVSIHKKNVKVKKKWWDGGIIIDGLVFIRLDDE
jgi:hypothetical protein